MACLDIENVWVTRKNKATITRFNILGTVQETVTATCWDHPSDISISKEGHLLYTNKVNKIVNDVQQTKPKITAPQGWVLLGLCFTQSDDLLISLQTNDKERYKIVRYEGQSIKQEIEKDDQGHPLYKGGGNMLFVAENNNGDICASDCNASIVTVVNKKGKLRFRYKGHQTMKKQFDPVSIVTDTADRILV
ncbi:uncharacterized protein LOC133204594 [Saccostrea echinata]|uniref:uncharacterized protein LOC133204594 n=1 Tax=Saccostrea echinata TaxID=191078 RepID=UPI002A83289A|nr:uncharacterized protein LOC133204594 [Saccostrea echinata]